MIHRTRPEGFVSQFEAVGCFVEDEKGYILQLFRPESAKIEPRKFGAPGGRINKRENPADAMVRELKEETGLTVSVSQLKLLYPVYVDYGNDIRFTYWMFHLKLGCHPEVILSAEHVASIWVKPVDALHLPLMKDEDACIKLFYFSEEIQ